MFLHNISEKRLTNLQESLSQNGLTLRQHHNMHMLPANRKCCSFCKAMLRLMQFVDFLATNLQMWHCCHPVRLSIMFILLHTALLIHKLFTHTFCSIWWCVVPQIMVTKPISDLCSICWPNGMTATTTSANQK